MGKFSLATCKKFFSAVLVLSLVISVCGCSIKPQEKAAVSKNKQSQNSENNFKDDYFGFSLNLPEGWKDLYKVEHKGINGLVFNYYGKSQFTHHYSLSNAEGQGIPLFYLGNEIFVKEYSSLIKDSMYAGKVSQTHFYAFTTNAVKSLLTAVLNSENLTKDYSAEEIENIKWDEAKCKELVAEFSSIISSFNATKESASQKQPIVLAHSPSKYTNDKLGVSVTFSYGAGSGLYNVQEVADNCVAVCYTGKSNIGNFYNEYLNIKGTPVFFIADEDFIKNMKDTSYATDEIVKLNSIAGTTVNSKGKNVYAFSVGRFTGIFENTLSKELQFLTSDEAANLSFDRSEYDKLYADFRGSVAKTLAKS